MLRSVLPILVDFFPFTTKNVFQTITKFVIHVKLNIVMLLICTIFLLFTFPTIYYGNKDSRMLEVIAADDPPITMQLEGMTVPPYGNPANYLKKENQHILPSHWYDMNYSGIIYYGGFYLNLAFAIFAPLKWLGLAETFPHAPLILKIISVASGLATLIILFLFTRKYWGTLAASLACAFLMTDPYFMEFTSRIHPDVLLCFLSLLCISISVSYAHQPQRISLIALAITIGLAQGTKAGAPWLLPTAGIALILANYNQIGTFNRKFFQAITKDSLVLGLTAILFFFISTPYAFIDSYYFTTMKNAYIANTAQSPILSSVNVNTWLVSTYQYLGKSTSLLFILVFIFSLLQLFKMKFTKKSEISFLLILILILSNFFWHAVISSYWVQLQYLIPMMALIGILFGIQVTHIINHLKQYQPLIIKFIGNTFISFIILLMFIYPLDNPRGASLIYYSLQRINLDNWTALEIGKWFTVHVLANKKIQHDGCAYI